VLAHEISGQVGQLAVAEVARAIRAAVAAEHEVKVRTVVLVSPGGTPRTSSGKVQRKLCATMFEARQLVEPGRSEISRPTGIRPPCVDLTGLLAAPGAERQRLLQDYLSGLVAEACGIDSGPVADAPLLVLGVDSCAMLTIQHSIEADLGVHLTISDLAGAVNVAALAARLADSFGRPTRDPEGVRLYCWVSGTRVPAHAAPGLAERPRWAS
jgi:Phosphopantetheine attachment site